MGEFKSPREVGATDSGSGWPAHQKAFEDSIIEAAGQPADTPFTGRILARLDDKGVANGIASLDAGGKVPSGQLPTIGGFVGARVYGPSSDQALTNDITNYVLFNGSEVFDTNNFHDLLTNPSRLTIPAGKDGYYLIFASMLISANVAAGEVLVAIWVNRSDTSSQQSGSIKSIGGINMNRSSILAVNHLAAGDYVEIGVYPTGATSPVARSPFCYFGIAKLPY